jgi:hypothetical protein
MTSFSNLSLFFSILLFFLKSEAEKTLRFSKRKGNEILKSKLKGGKFQTRETRLIYIPGSSSPPRTRVPQLPLPRPTTHDLPAFDPADRIHRRTVRHYQNPPATARAHPARAFLCQTPLSSSSANEGVQMHRYMVARLPPKR